ncbi:M23 family metallopeptidase [Desulfolucanica intricata]|uniref:M23 family metallopeptidase n=1 Tax=Desulfolucanica intricata TaxID=1285191 RepID=UPI00082A83C1|nr:M23 family metallopeptidase [Desulfolucanica intricata]
MKFRGLKFNIPIKRKKPPIYSSGEDWLDYTNYLPPPGRGFAGKKKSRRKIFNKAVLAGIILLGLVALRESPGPLGETVKNNLRYVLTTEWNYEPVVQRVVQFGLQLANVDTPQIINTPTAPVFAPKTMDEGLPLPVSGKVVNRFGWVKDDLDGMERYHAGIDIAAAENAPVIAVKTGTVKKIGEDPKLGPYVLLDHGNGCLTMYAQLQNIAVKEKEKVRAGQKIGEVGTVGDVDGSGLHFEIRENEKLVDPLNKLRQTEQEW